MKTKKKTASREHCIAVRFVYPDMEREVSEGGYGQTGEKTVTLMTRLTNSNEFQQEVKKAIASIAEDEERESENIAIPDILRFLKEKRIARQCHGRSGTNLWDCYLD
jgi:hypothetical protein